MKALEDLSHEHDLIRRMIAVLEALTTDLTRREGILRQKSKKRFDSCARRCRAIPTIDQRIKWHVQHQEYCSCREIPGRVKAEMKKRRIEVLQ